MISILIPIYNGVEFFPEALNSVINQDYDNWELIVGINGHTENSTVYKEVVYHVNNIQIDNFINKSPNVYKNKIRVIDFFNIRGKANTLNEMIRFCNGDYVAILDVDDIWHANKLSSQASYMELYDVIGTKCVYFGSRLQGVVPNIPVGDLITQNFNFTTCNPIINSSVLIRKDLCRWTDGIEGVEDYDLWLRLWKQKCSFYNVESACVQHRLHEESAFNSQGNHLKVKDIIKKYL
jgi:glycosyltransferase involved in cell wall biosynthesis